MPPVNMNISFNPFDAAEATAARNLISDLIGETYTDDTAAPQIGSLAPGATAGEITLDNDGVPHDSRIHSANPTINTGDGKWKKRKGISDVEHSRITKELQAMVAAQIPSGIPAGAPSMFPEPAAAIAPPPRGPAPAAPIAAAPLAAPPKPQPEALPVDFETLLPWIGKRIANKTLPEKEVVLICKHYGFVDATGAGSLHALGEGEDTVYAPYIYQYLTETIGEDYLPGHVKLK